jgi:hypothetical protein
MKQSFGVVKLGGCEVERVSGVLGSEQKRGGVALRGYEAARM